ncbi:DUF1488 family protein [Salmonella enterica]
MQLTCAIKKDVLAYRFVEKQRSNGWPFFGEYRWDLEEEAEALILAPAGR